MLLCLTKEVPALGTVQSVCAALLLLPRVCVGFWGAITWLCCRSAHRAMVGFMLTAGWGWVTRDCMLQQRPRSLAFPAATRLIPTGPDCLDLGR